jgi:hypothetical protein
MAKLNGSRLVRCKCGRDNYLLPGTERKCGGDKCRRTVKVERAKVRGKRRQIAAKVVKAAKKPKKPARGRK